jgi:iron uptake system component EfeO
MHRSIPSQPSLLRVAIPILVALALSACAAPGGASATAGSGDGGGTAVNVTLQDWAVVPDAESAPAGDVTFTVTNNGPEDVHEFVVLSTDLDPGDLSTDEHGAVDEEGDGVDVVDEIEDIPVGETEELNVTLEAGNYVLLCNIYDEDEDEAHYQMGMRTAFEVTDN